MKQTNKWLNEWMNESDSRSIEVDIYMIHSVHHNDIICISMAIDFPYFFHWISHLYMYIQRYHTHTFDTIMNAIYQYSYVHRFSRCFEFINERNAIGSMKFFYCHIIDFGRHVTWQNDLLN